MKGKGDETTVVKAPTEEKKAEAPVVEKAAEPVAEKPVEAAKAPEESFIPPEL